MTLCRALRVIEVGTSTWRQITWSLSRNSMRTVAISLKLSNAALRPAGLMRPVWQSRSSSSRAGVGRGGGPDDRRCGAAHGIDRQWGLSQIGQFEEVAPAVGPAGRLGNRPRPSLGIVELAEPGIGVGLEDPGIAGAMPGGMLAVAVARVAEDCRRRVRAAERPIVPDIGP